MLKNKLRSFHFPQSLLFVMCIFIPSQAVFAKKHEWKSSQNKICDHSSRIPGSCSYEKAKLISETIRKNRLKKCVEIGVFYGASSYSIVNTLKYQKSGKAYLIDAWNTNVAVEGLPHNDPNCIWWKQQKMQEAFKYFSGWISNKELSPYFEVKKMHSMNAVKFFKNKTIDFIHFDSNHQEDQFYQEVTRYFSKVKNDGYILVSDCNWPCMRKGIVYLLERTSIESPYVRDSQFVLLRKQKRKILKIPEVCNAKK